MWTTTGHDDKLIDQIDTALKQLIGDGSTRYIQIVPTDPDHSLRMWSSIP
jgi:hypothetical protein